MNFRNSGDHKQPIKKEKIRTDTSPKYTDGP